MLIRFHSSTLVIALSCSLPQRVKAMASDNARRGGEWNVFERKTSLSHV